MQPVGNYRLINTVINFYVSVGDPTRANPFDNRPENLTFERKKLNCIEISTPPHTFLDPCRTDS